MLILHYAPLVKYVASRGHRPAGECEQADLVSYGMFGLIDAGSSSSTVASSSRRTRRRIRGAIIDELRSLDWVPRSVRFKHREFEKAYAEVESRLKRAPTDREIAEHLGISLGELHDIVTQISSVSILALDEPVSVGSDRGETISLMDTLTDVAHGDLIEGLRATRCAPCCPGDQPAVRPREDRRHALLLRGPDLSETATSLG